MLTCINDQSQAKIFSTQLHKMLLLTSVDLKLFHALKFQH